MGTKPIVAETAASAALGLPAWLMEAALDTSEGCDQGAALQLLDEFLCRLASLQHLPLYARSVLAGRIVARGAHRASSSHAVRDFAREHGGMSGETFYKMARVGTLAETCPKIGAAFFGREIHYSHMTALARIATPDNEDLMLAAARSMNVKQLEAYVREQVCESGQSERDEEDGPLFEITSEDGLPRSVWILLEWCRDLLRKVDGKPVSMAKTLVLASVEYLSGPDLGGGGHVPRRWHIGPRRAVEGGAGGVGPSEESLAWEVSDLLEELDRTTGLTRLPLKYCELLEGLDACTERELVERFIESDLLAGPIEMALGRLLDCFRRLRLARHTAHRTFDRYVKERLGMSGSQARLLARVDAHFRDCDPVMEAYERGGVNALRLDTIREVATGPYKQAWGRRAHRDVTMVKRLEQEVRWATVERDLRESEGIGPPPLGETLPPVDQQISTHGGLPERPEPVAPLRVVMPEEDAALVLQALQRATKPDEPSVLALVRVLLHAARTWSTLPRHRDKTFDAHGFWCQHPGCTECRDLHAHHIHKRSLGGGNEPKNLIPLCWFDHQENLHATGRSKAWRDVDGVLRWEIGRAPGREPLIVLQGEVIVSRWRPPA